jgi:hypothetical protein
MVAEEGMGDGGRLVRITPVMGLWTQADLTVALQRIGLLG